MYNFNEETIREAAYYIWKNNGCKNGTALSDWDAAIHQLSCQAAFATRNASASKKASCSKKSTTKKTAAKKTTSLKTNLKNMKSFVLNPISTIKK